MILKRLLTISFFMLLITSCRTMFKEEPGFNNKVKIEKRDNTNSISIVEMAFDIKKGDNVGYHYTGAYPIKSKEYVWSTTQDLIANKDVISYPEKQLEDNGYTVYCAPGNKKDYDQRFDARYQIKGKISSIKFNSYSFFSKRALKTELNVLWTLYDSFEQKDLYSKETKGRYYTKNATNRRTISAAIGQAIKDSFKPVLADTKFINSIENGEDKLKVIEIKNEDRGNSIKLPGDTESILDSVVVIYSEDGHGSGVVISKDGYIVTAAHVISGFREVNIRMYDETEVKGKVIRVNTEKDLALIKVDNSNFKYLEIHKDRESIGKDIYVIGAPLSQDLSYSVSKGILSGYRNIDDLRLIQTDTNINPGNSGGPLLNINGKVIGIVSWKIVADGFEGLAFAVDTRYIEEDLSVQIIK